MKTEGMCNRLRLSETLYKKQKQIFCTKINNAIKQPSLNMAYSVLGANKYVPSNHSERKFRNSNLEKTFEEI
ncbi:hypothetical protein BpHYR1_040591 [Brachionus plicatilis]|uniref:Uncharacterized protein n=1 Tax=Brachionus plicatilis TaxID=10195 RepID=A0A3M7RI06_BRAPC|nr:hypothetical protein BpHYR1_040591 [Brachionus plicatilis]